MNKGKDLKPHIGIFGRTNNGKSSFINNLTGQRVAIVSDVPGTTTDPVKKSMEIFGIGPAIIIDTAGMDDESQLGKMRVEKTMDVLKLIDAAVLLISENRFDEPEIEMINSFAEFDIPFVVVHNKSDLEEIKLETIEKIRAFTTSAVIDFCSMTLNQNEELIEALKKTIPVTAYQKPSLFKGMIKDKDVVLLVTPIDSEAPDGRMILPQVMALRDVLDNHCICIIVRETELEDFFKLGIKPALVVTDSQAFKFVSSIVPKEIPLTGFSIAFARLKGNFEHFIKGTPAIDKLKNGDKVLILESCTHQVSCEDIGRHKLPDWIRKHTGKEIEFEIVAGIDNRSTINEKYALVIQCGGCVATEKQVVNKLKPFIEKGIPVTNYGMAIAWMNGIFTRATNMYRIPNPGIQAGDIDR
ncbi:MAG: [FeFe] hydrogenase H-cluster maturation GTPase HydF [Bacteroidetes bacterium GWF2_38_335]|nr:MAG: [FeFe] hydrogenase H-cluster maturation GTPase HydF [Bacteroidetes bacterium GWF2_38_335]OFY81189.1 MAG: [FeFe] hydrogenase H-cluster maturation GTPase HydF [Bacteroidetes bacterium RIFOXYA12_FULL_38_20]HBS85304.1 [FeFe] hydrogenase H-cluster maturation GTPase HydF [Bacteroidales bacterium]